MTDVASRHVGGAPQPEEAAPRAAGDESSSPAAEGAPAEGEHQLRLMVDAIPQLAWMAASDGYITIREATRADADAIWPIFHHVVRAGDTYAYSPDITRAEFEATWFAPDVRTYVALAEGEAVGTYVLKPNQPGLGAHVANAGYMVAPRERGRGVGQALGLHSLDEARRLGYRAMQFNLVVSTNEAAVALWRELGFAIVGTLPEAFRHRERGLVDAYVMYRRL